MPIVNEKSDLSVLGHAALHTPTEKGLAEELCAAFEGSQLSVALRLQNFPRHVRRQDIARFLAKYEIFKQVLSVNGSIAECGVFAGGGIMTWEHFSAILEPYNHTRRIVGFDSFAGFPDVHEKDLKIGSSEHLHKGALATNSTIKDEIEYLVARHDRNRPLGHIPKVELVAGDACETIPEYVKQNPHLLISLMYLDFDIYEPTRVALQNLYPRVVKGGIIAFDELNCSEFPGETSALLETLDLAHVELRRFPFEPYISYFIK
jgi:hypothetical protein